MHLIKLELDFVGWGQWTSLPVESDECPFWMKFLDMPPNPPLPAFPQLQELSLSYAAIGPAFAFALDVESLVLLKLHHCTGWNRFLKKMTESKIMPKLKTLEISSSLDLNEPPGWEERAIAKFIGSFAGLEKFHLHFFVPWYISWVPTRTFWTGFLRHSSTLRSCIFDRLWDDKTEAMRSLGLAQQNSWLQQYMVYTQRQHTALQQIFDHIERNPRSNFLDSLNLECLGLMNEPTCLVRIGLLSQCVSFAVTL